MYHVPGGVSRGPLCVGNGATGSASAELKSPSRAEDPRRASANTRDFGARSERQLGRALVSESLPHRIWGVGCATDPPPPLRPPPGRDHVPPWRSPLLVPRTLCTSPSPSPSVDPFWGDRGGSWGSCPGWVASWPQGGGPEGGIADRKARAVPGPVRRTRSTTSRPVCPSRSAKQDSCQFGRGTRT